MTEADKLILTNQIVIMRVLQEIVQDGDTKDMLITQIMVTQDKIKTS